MHDAIVTWKLLKLMLLPLNVEEQRDHSLDDVMARVYSSIIKVGIPLLCLTNTPMPSNPLVFFVFMQPSRCDDYAGGNHKVRQPQWHLGEPSEGG